jgi:SWIM zinc finger
MSSVAHPPSPRIAQIISELYGDRDTTPPVPQPPTSTPQQAVVQAAEQVVARPATPVDPARLTKAMDLVMANAVSLLPDGTARVRSGSHTYHLAPDCTCEDAQRRGNGCKHKLAVDIHRRATALLEGTAPAPAPSSAPAAPSASPLAVPPSLCGAGGAVCTAQRVGHLARSGGLGQCVLQMPPERVNGTPVHVQGCR